MIIHGDDSGSCVNFCKVATSLGEGSAGWGGLVYNHCPRSLLSMAFGTGICLPCFSCCLIRTGKALILKQQ